MWGAYLSLVVGVAILLHTHVYSRGPTHYIPLWHWRLADSKHCKRRAVISTVCRYITWLSDTRRKACFLCRTHEKPPTMCLDPLRPEGNSYGRRCGAFIATCTYYVLTVISRYSGMAANQLSELEVYVCTTERSVKFCRHSDKLSPYDSPV